MNDGEGIVFGLQRFSVDDGPGVRTTVFLKGCDLHCRWCHNPESIDPCPGLAFNADRCADCGLCVDGCPNGAHTMPGEGKHILDRSVCRRCGACAAICPTGALEMSGRRMTAADVMRTVDKDRRYYRDGGGVTFSGGEPTRQLPFLTAMLVLAANAGIDTAIETNGHADRETYLRLLPLVGVFLWDVKETDPARHRLYTGVGNEKILGNLRAVGEAGGRIVLRCPLVPGLNDRPDHLNALRRLAATTPGVEAVQIMPYHALGRGKAARFGLPATTEYAPPDAGIVQRWTEALGF